MSCVSTSAKLRNDTTASGVGTAGLSSGICLTSIAGLRVCLAAGGAALRLCDFVNLTLFFWGAELPPFGECIPCTPA
jgi:hypothetical protein